MATLPNPFFSEEPPESRPLRAPLKRSKKFKRTHTTEEPRSSVDETPDFHDPFSDLSLFIFKHLKKALPNLGFPKNWNLKLQDGLIKAITPEFKKIFPQYRLGVTALKKAFEKLLSLSDLVKHQKEAFSQDGKVNVSFLIRENLKQFHYFKTPSCVHPYHFAHQLSMRIGECQAIIDGTRPQINTLGQTIWSIQRHLLKEIDPAKTKTPFDERDVIDELIVKSILEITADDPFIGQAHLVHAMREKLHTLPSRPIEDEKVNALIDAPHISEPSLSKWAKKVRALEKSPNIDQKIYKWCIQSDMLLRWIHLKSNTPLMHLILSDDDPFNTYLRIYPHMTPHSAAIEKRLITLKKYCYYHDPKNSHKSSFECFVSWHQSALGETTISDKVKKVIQHRVPLIPLSLIDHL